MRSQFVTAVSAGDIAEVIGVHMVADETSNPNRKDGVSLARWRHFNRDSVDQFKTLMGIFGQFAEGKEFCYRQPMSYCHVLTPIVYSILRRNHRISRSKRSSIIYRSSLLTHSLSRKSFDHFCFHFPT